MRTRRLMAAVIGLVMTAAGAPAVAGVPQDTVGVVDQATGVWYLRDASNGATTSFYYGNPGDYPMVGDWDCNGTDTPGLYRQSDGYVYLRNSNTQGIADIRFFFGNSGDVPLAGDFNADGCDTVSTYRPSEARIYVINRLGVDDGGLGAADHAFDFGNLGDKPFTGDFNDNGQDTVGLHRESTGFVYYRDTLTTGTADNDFFYGDPGDQIITGRWAQNPGVGPDTVGIFRPTAGRFFLRFSNTLGKADTEFGYGNRDMLPVAGGFGYLPGGDDSPPAPASGLDVVPRDEWGALPPEVTQLTPHTIRTLTVHHAGDQSATTGPSRYRSWQSLHMRRGWGDLAYHFIVGVDGTVYEARDTRYAGATGTNYDPDGHLLVVVEGNFETDIPTQSQLDSLVTVLAWAATAFEVSPSTIAGHRDHAATACPGEHLYPYIASGQLEADVRDVASDG